MENHSSNIEKMIIKLKVLENRIHQLELIANEVLNEVKSEYEQQLTELTHKKEEANQLLIKIQEAGLND